jgi:hypothetical protein
VPRVSLIAAHGNNPSQHQVEKIQKDMQLRSYQVAALELEAALRESYASHHASHNYTLRQHGTTLSLWLHFHLAKM